MSWILILTLITSSPNHASPSNISTQQIEFTTENACRHELQLYLNHARNPHVQASGYCMRMR